MDQPEITSVLDESGNFVLLRKVAEHFNLSTKMLVATLEQGDRAYVRANRSYRANVSPSDFHIALAAARYLSVKASLYHREPMIYLISCENALKVGISVDIDKRLDKMQVGNPFELRLRGSVEGDRAIEDAIHTRLKAHHIRGEWFRMEGRTLDLLQLAEAHPGSGLPVKEARSWIDANPLVPGNHPKTVVDIDFSQPYQRRVPAPKAGALPG